MGRRSQHIAPAVARTTRYAPGALTLDTPVPEPDEAPKRAKEPLRAARLAPLIAAYALVAVLPGELLRTFAIETFVFDGPSMRPTLDHGDRFLVDRASWGLTLPGATEAVASWAEPERGQVVVVTSPLDDIRIVKRILGLPGDVVEVRSGRMVLNGELLTVEEVGPCAEREGRWPGGDECRVFQETLPAADGSVSYFIEHDRRYDLNVGPTVVPEGHVYLRGDHRDMSNDSTNALMGPVASTRVVGDMVEVYWRGGP